MILIHIHLPTSYSKYEFELFNKVGYYQGGNSHSLLTDLIDPIRNIFVIDDIGKIIFIYY